MDWLEYVLDTLSPTLLVVAGIASIAAGILGQLGLPWIVLPKRWQRILAFMFGTLFLVLGVALEQFPAGSQISISEQTVPLDNFEMTLQKCERSPEDNVKCSFWLMPTQDLYFALRCQYGNATTNILDTSGIDHKCNLAKLASDESVSYLTKPLSQSKGVSAVLIFNDIPPEIKELAGITVYYNFTIG